MFDYLIKYSYVTGTEIKPSDQTLVCEKRKMEYTSSSQEFTNQTKAYLEQDKKPLEAIERISLLQQKLKKI